MKGKKKQKLAEYKPVLLTQCIQRDYLVNDVKNSSTDLPAIFIGAHESRRLLGGPLLHVLERCRKEASDGNLDMLHVRDYHNLERDAKHLRAFGVHCVEGTPGAQLICGDPPAGSLRERLIDAPSLNDFLDTPIESILESIRGGDSSTVLRVGLIGCWTEGKISFNCYELCSRENIEVAICSCLTAGASITAHHAALAQMEQMFDVRLFEGSTEFLQWLLGDEAVSADLDAVFAAEPVVHSSTALSPLDTRVMQLLYSDCKSVSLETLSGGFSGAAVYKAVSVDKHGRSQMPTVVKLDRRVSAATERIACEQTEMLLGRYAPQVFGYQEVRDRGGIKFAYAGGTSNLHSLRDLAADSPVATVTPLIRRLFKDVLGNLYQAPTFDTFNLFEFYQFDGKGWAYAAGGSDTPSKVRERIEAILPGQGDSQVLTFADGSQVRSIAEFLERDVARLNAMSADSKNLSCWNHADLHGDNVLVSDDDGNVVVIDFGYTRANCPILMDATKLESDLQYHVTQLESDAELVQAMALSRALYSINDVGVPLLDCPAEVTSEKLIRLWSFIAALRLDGVSRVVAAHRSSFPLHLALLRYCLHSLTFTHYSPLNRAWVLYSACLLAQDVLLRRRFQAKQYQMYSLGSEFVGPGYVFMGEMPGRNYSVDDTIQTLKENGISLAVILVDIKTVRDFTGELPSWLAAKLAENGIRSVYHSYFEASAPSLQVMDTIVSEICAEAAASKNSIVIDIKGLGLSGTTLACVARRASAQVYSVEEILKDLIERRGDTRVVESQEQRRLVAAFR